MRQLAQTHDTALHFGFLKSFCVFIRTETSCQRATDAFGTTELIIIIAYSAHVMQERFKPNMRLGVSIVIEISHVDTLLRVIARIIILLTI